MAFYSFTIVLALQNYMLRCFGPLDAHNSGLRSLPELRIELPVSLQRARGRETGLRS